MKHSTGRNMVAAGAALSLLAGFAQVARADFTIGFPFGLPVEVTLNNATHHDWQVFLTESGGQAGSMFYAPKQNVQNGFQTTFRFTVTEGSVATGDGFAFVIQNDSVNALGGGGSDLGYAGIHDGVAIEFDTFFFSGELNGMHVSVQGVDDNGDLSADDSWSIAHHVLDVGNGEPSIVGTHEGHIEYVPPSGPSEGELRVFLDNQLVLSTPIDLGDANGSIVYDGNGESFVGFTAGTGLADSEQSVESWAFFGDTNGDCMPPGGFIGFWGGCGIGCVEGAGVTVVGSRAMTYDWYKDGNLITSDDGGRILGLGTSSITVTDFTIEDRGDYHVQVTNACGTLDGGTYPLGGPPCDSIDFNNDGSFFDPQDIDAFLSVFSEGPCIPETAACSDIDFNNDGSLFDPCDIDSFLLRFSEGPCTLCGV